ncbi:nuclear transport factor 2 family protein [Geodermatophilus sp. SYSU D00766]
MTEPDRDEVIRSLYRAYSAHDLDAVIDVLSPDVDWPNAWEGGRVHGRDAVRAYWERQWAHIRPSARPTTIRDRPDGSVEVTVALVVRDPAGTLLSRTTVRHVYQFAADGRVRRMDVRYER